MLSAVPREEREWVVRHGELRTCRRRRGINSKAMGLVFGLMIVLSGQIAIYVDRGAGPQRMLAWTGGDISGLLPYSRMKEPPGNTIAEEPTEVFAIPRECLQEMTRECHEFTSMLVHVMLDRARKFTSTDAQNERMVSLGTLAAGLAHELNNPASAVARSARLLGDHLTGVEPSSRELGEARLHRRAARGASMPLRAAATAPVNRVRSPIEEATHESEISDWLADHGVSDPSPRPRGSAITIEALDALAKSVDPNNLGAAVRWVAEGSAVRRLAREIEQAGVADLRARRRGEKFSRDGSGGRGGAGEPRRRAHGVLASCATRRNRSR